MAFLGGSDPEPWAFPHIPSLVEGNCFSSAPHYWHFFVPSSFRRHWIGNASEGFAISKFFTEDLKTLDTPGVFQLDSPGTNCGRHTSDPRRLSICGKGERIPRVYMPQETKKMHSHACKGKVKYGVLGTKFLLSIS